MNRSYFYALRENYILKKNQSKTSLNLRDELQESHFVVPADNISLVEKALHNGCRKSPEILEKYSITLDDLSQVLETDVMLIKNILDNNYYPDLVLIDGEDATVLNQENIKASRKNAIESLNQRSNHNFKIYYRPSGMELDYCIDDICEVIENTKTEKKRSMLDGIIFPKVESAEEILIIINLMDQLEKHRGIEPNTIKIQFLIESALGVESIMNISDACKNRLTGIIFGMADYSSELGITSLDENHAMFQFAKSRIINSAAIHNVCAIDCMNFNYPVPDRTLSLSENKRKILDSIRHLHDLYISSVNMGMHGKWVGHPLQLLTVKIAAEKIYDIKNINRLMEKLEAYSLSSKGAAVIHGAMADRATDRSIRAFLRRAVLKGKIDAMEARKLGIIDDHEFDFLSTKFNS